jgi:hypothetical protein
MHICAAYCPSYAVGRRFEASSADNDVISPAVAWPNWEKYPVSPLCGPSPLSEDIAADRQYIEAHTPAPCIAGHDYGKT